MSRQQSRVNARYEPTRIAMEVLGVSTDTLRKWHSEGKIEAIRTSETSQRLYNVEGFVNRFRTGSLASFTNDEKRIIGYCRVSTRSQANDLTRQVESMRERYPNSIIVEDVGSGINWNRKGLQSIIRQVLAGEVSDVVIHHRDRLCRFAFELLEFLFDQCGTKIVVLEQIGNEQNLDQELADDLLSIIHIFSCKKMGRRRYQNKTTNSGNLENVRAETDKGSDRTVERMDEHLSMDGKPSDSRLQ